MEKVLDQIGYDKTEQERLLKTITGQPDEIALEEFWERLHQSSCQRDAQIAALQAENTWLREALRSAVQPQNCLNVGRNLRVCKQGYEEAPDAA